MYKILLTFLIFGVFQCDKTEVNAENVLVGEWRYVGTFNGLTSYKCEVCGDFDFNKSIYRLNFLDANNYTAKINLLNATGEYNISFEGTNTEVSMGTFENINIQILNKPYETEADTKFQTMFTESTNFSLSQKNAKQTFDELRLGSNNSEYLLFVRK